MLLRLLAVAGVAAVAAAVRVLEPAAGARLPAGDAVQVRLDGVRGELCVATAPMPDAARLPAFAPTCFPGAPDAFTLSELEPGRHALALFDEGGARLLQALAFSVHARTPFVPDYTWQPVEDWHVVPPGLEIRMPLTDGESKTARKPSPWRLQKGVGRVILRFDVWPASTVGDLRAALAERLGVAPACAWVGVDGLEGVADDELLDSLGVFERQGALKLGDNCHSNS